VTRSQQMASRAFERASQRANDKEFASFAKSFPALIRTAGLCQAVGFTLAKGGAQKRVLEDVVHIVNEGNPASVVDFAEATRTAPIVDYMRLTRLAMQAATWLKRYVEGLEKAGADGGETVGEAVP